MHWSKWTVVLPAILVAQQAQLPAAVDAIGSAPEAPSAAASAVEKAGEATFAPPAVRTIPLFVPTFVMTTLRDSQTMIVPTTITKMALETITEQAVETVTSQAIRTVTEQSLITKSSVETSVISNGTSVLIVTQVQEKTVLPTIIRPTLNDFGGTVSSYSKASSLFLLTGLLAIVLAFF